MSRRPISNAMSGILGFGTDAYAHFKEKKAGAGGHQNIDPAADSSASSSGQDVISKEAYDYESYDEDDEGDWVRDETQSELPAYKAAGEDAENVDEIIEHAKTEHSKTFSSHSAARQGLPVPVIIPERRPGSKHRGFVRAYAPVLMDCGIDQNTFMDFLTGFETSIKASPCFHVVNIAVAASVMAEGIAAAPSIIVHVAAFAVHTSIEAGRRAYMSNENNKYLDGMNNDLFKPHGLYAMLMTWKPDSSSSSVIATVDINAKMISSVAARETEHRSKLHSTSGKTIGQSQMPESAELIFPVLEKASQEQKENAMKRAGHWAGEWRDKRSQAKFANEHPESTLSTNSQPQEFSSRWNDPSHAVNQGSGIIGVLSGGHLGRAARKDKRRERLGKPKQEPSKAQRTGPLRSAKRKLHENVLYLIIVNMPSEDELKLVAAIAKEKKM